MAAKIFAVHRSASRNDWLRLLTARSRPQDSRFEIELTFVFAVMSFSLASVRRARNNWDQRKVPLCESPCCTSAQVTMTGDGARILQVTFRSTLRQSVISNASDGSEQKNACLRTRKKVQAQSASLESGNAPSEGAASHFG